MTALDANAAVTPLSLDDVRARTADLIPSLTATVEQVAQHEHPVKGGDLFCLNLTSFMGERMATVLHRLTAEVAEVDRLRARIEDRRRRLVDAESDLLDVRGILSPNGYPRRVPMELVPTVAPAVRWLADRVDELTDEIRRLRAEARPDITDRQLLVSIRRWLRESGWHWNTLYCWTNALYIADATISVEWDNRSITVGRRDGGRWRWDSREYPVDSVRQAVDILVALDILPARFSSAHRSALAGDR